MEKAYQNVETPDEALERVRNIPGLSAQQLEDAANWATNQNHYRAEFGKKWVREKRSAIQAESKELDDLIFMVNQDSSKLRERLGKRELADTAEGFKETRRLAAMLTEYEARISALRTTHETAERVWEDPAAWYHEFFNRWTALRDRVPTIEQAIYR